MAWRTTPWRWTSDGNRRYKAPVPRPTPEPRQPSPIRIVLRDYDAAARYAQIWLMRLRARMPAIAD